MLRLLIAAAMAFAVPSSVVEARPHDLQYADSEGFLKGVRSIIVEMKRERRHGPGQVRRGSGGVRLPPYSPITGRND
jgi:hypothetical protein